MIKEELRKIYRKKRAELTPAEMNRLDDLLLIRFQQWPLAPINTLLSFRPIEGRGEVNTHLITDYLLFRMPGLQIAYPVMDKEGFNFQALLTDGETQYKRNAFGIEEPVHAEPVDPTELDAVLVPLLISDMKGYRVGYGKGYYDRFLYECRTDVLKIGFSYFEPVDQIDDIHQFDIPLSICVTPNKVYEF
ncbi:MAG: 5-formyltetrahydrofolate cyclo-ligase [Williamsia sp.]|nr:5-formyltetrahydrofolate cyclo-ligase [Williamsia sp.]